MPLRLLDTISDEAAPQGSTDRAVEADHRIANNLAVISGLIRMKATRLADQPTLPTTEVRGLLRDIAVRIDAVARLHRLIMRHAKQPRVDLADYIREVADAAMCCLGSHDQTLLSLELEAATEVSPRDAAAIGLLVGEAMTNALKYAHPTGVQGKLRVASSGSSGNGFVIEVTDDGVGLPEGCDPHRAGSIGFLVMRSAAKQLGGWLTFEQTAIGLSVRLEVPPARPDFGSRHH